jgi:predicted metalloprotease
MDTAVRLVDLYWRRHWSEFFTGSYAPPTVLGLYDGSDPQTAPLCGTRPLGANNAYYCKVGDYVAWDQQLMLLGGQRIGDSWVYLIIAHEWGHAIQARLRKSLVTKSAELQADCLAGATLYGSKADGRLDIEEGDQKELVDSLSAVADETAWTSSDDHGDPFERVEFFNRGRTGGVDACLPSS